MVVDGVESNLTEVSCGVPQGSVLGPLLFLSYVNYIIHSSNIFRFSLFADDAVAVLSHKNLHTLISLVNEELAKLLIWFQSNKLLLNQDKTKYIIFCSRNRRVPRDIDSISANGTIIQCVKSLTFLGVIIDESLDWKTHINNKALKVSRGVGIMSKLKYVVPKKVLMLLYNSIILPHLSYCNIVWGNSYSSHLTELKLLQKRAIRIISHAEYNSPIYPLFREKQILPVQELITLDTLIFMYRFHTGNVPQIFKCMFIKNSSVHSYNTRHKLLLHKPPVRTTHALKSFRNIGISTWNRLSEDIRSSSTVSRLKTMCKRDLLNDIQSWVELQLALPELNDSNPLGLGGGGAVRFVWGKG